MKKIVCVILSIIFCSVLGLSYPSADTSDDVIVSLTIVPAEVVSVKSSVELRAGLINNNNISKKLTIDFLSDGIVLKTNAVTVEADSFKMSNFWWNPVGNSGCKVLGIVVKQDGKIIAEEYRVMTVLDTDTKSPGILTIAWEEPGAYSDGCYPALKSINQQDVANQVKDMNALGIDTIIFTYSEFILYNTGAYYDSELPEFVNAANPHPIKYDLLDTMLKAAETYGMNVIIGPGRGKDLFIPTTTTAFNNAVDLAVRVMTEIWQKYGHYKSFYGWYMTHEPSYLFDTGNGDLKFFNAIISKVRMKWPDKIVMCAPTGTPQIVTTAMKNSQIDIFAFQDAVGPGYMPGQYTYDPEKRIATLDDVFKNYRVAMDKVGKHMWSDLETWEMQGPTYTNAYPALWSRVERQINIEKKYSSALSMYAYSGFLASPSSTVQIGGNKAVKLYENYSAYANKYMSTYKIHNHHVKSATIDFTVTDLSKVLALIPEMVTVQLKECSKMIKVPVVWSSPVASSGSTTVTGKITMQGIESATVKAIVKKGTTNVQVLNTSVPSSSITSSAVSIQSAISTNESSDGLSEISELSSSGDSDTYASEGSSSNAMQSSGTEQSKVVTNIESEDYSIISTTAEKPYNSNKGRTTAYILIGALIIIGAGAIVYLKTRKK